MTRNFNPEFVRSKSCRDCSDRIYYSLQDRQWCSDSDLQIRHKCDKWKPREDKNEEIINVLDHISRIQIDHSAQLSLIKKVLWEVSQDVKRLRGDHE